MFKCAGLFTVLMDTEHMPLECKVKSDHSLLLSFIRRKQTMTTVEHQRMSSSSSSNDDTPKSNGEKSAKDATATSGDTSPAVKVSASGDDPETSSKFAGAGLDFKGKLIGIEEVPEPRGDKMCQVAMAKLKAGVKAAGDHKQRITINVSLEGIKIIDEKTSEVMHTHEVSKISFIARDNGDSRAFGYVFKRNEGSHQFFGIKTEKAAEGLVLSLRDLFQTVFDIKKRKMAETNNNSSSTPATDSKTEEQSKSEDKPDSLLNIDLDIVSLTKSAESTGNAPGGLSPSLAMLDPWNSSSPVQQQQTQSMSAVGGGSLFQQIGPNASMPTTANAPLMIIPPFHSAGTALISSAPPGSTFPGAVVWPPPMMATGGTAAVPTWGSPFPTANVTSGGFSANPNAAATARDPFAAFNQPAQGPPPLAPARRISPNNPFAVSPTPGTSAPAPARHDPFAELAVLSGATSSTAAYQHPIKKTDKKDFFQEPPKPSLFDLSQQQQQELQQTTAQIPQSFGQPVEPVRDLFGATPFSSLSSANDPFA